MRAGKILYAGASNFPAWRVAAAVTLADGRGWAPMAALQLEYSLVERAADRELLPMAAGLGLGVMGYSPLAGGMLTGKYRTGDAGRATALKGSVRASDGRTTAIVDAVLAVAAEAGCSPGAVALAWAVHQGVVPIVGPRTQAQLLDYLAAAPVVLDEAHVRRLDEASRIELGHPHDLLAAQRRQLGLTDARAGRVA